MKILKSPYVVGALLLLAVLRWFACAPTTHRGPTKFLTNRVWFSRMPKNGREPAVHLALFEQMGKKGGAVVVGSAFRFMVDVVDFEVRRGKLTLTVLQDKKRATFKARTWACKTAPRPFDLCLELERQGRTVTLFSSRKMRIGPRPKALAAMLDNPEAFGLLSDTPVDAGDYVEATPAWFEQRRGSRH